MSDAPLFGDGKDAGALRSIGEVSAALGVKPHVLRYWEEQFAQLNPLKRAGGRRLYRPDDVALIRRIDQLINQQGYTLRGAQSALANPERALMARPHDETAPSSQRYDAASASVRTRLVAIRQSLADALTDD